MKQDHFPSEKELMIEPRWFTGQQWVDGTAQRSLRAEFAKAVEDYHRSHKKAFARAHRVEQNLGGMFALNAFKKERGL